MPPKVSDYLIVREFLLPDFHNAIRVALNDGWQPHGHLIVSAVYHHEKRDVNRAYIQAMVRYSEATT
jgi:hypothetical protein